MRLLLTILVSLGFLNCEAQEKLPVKSNSEFNSGRNSARYGLDYHLKNYSFTNGDSTVLNQLNLNTYESLRNDTVDVEVQDAATGLIIVLHNRREMLERKGIYRSEY